MIKFFRKIRQKLLTENKFSKYLIYAIGEIILVVIGILIALQINNWNEHRKTAKELQSYYQQILIEINQEKQYIDRELYRLNKSIATYEAYTEYIKNSELKPNEIIQELGKIELTFSYLTFSNETITSLETTGEIKLIPESIRNKLIESKRLKEVLISQQAGNDQLYLEGQKKAFELGFNRLLKYTEPYQGINVNRNTTEIILTLEYAFGLKNYTENDKIRMLNGLLENIMELEAMIRKEQK
ncbi:hypothetical protein OD91_1353 [Lutibacter sp. Hel_I_33_5]|uniref:DUF6090 family protein n=1 Tax=Lutibacter sp. Hel_I_33_5 TaxID=1566289 RepID=UPI00119CF1A4|nr:DUF6090 family protein [Lutibacter sp. Hel_I_33_5]TVZ56074.1 hypothetical protein OD91_1353 [Lutibacter sp. Hel_I_33_5]